MPTARPNISERQAGALGILALVAACGVLSMPAEVQTVAQAQTPGALTPAFRRALDEAQPGWRVAPVTERIRGRHVTNAGSPEPNVLAGDFDGNGHQDRAVLLVFPTKAGAALRSQLIVLLQMEDQIQVVRIDKPIDPDPHRFLSGRGRGEKLHDLNTNREFVCRNQAISVDYDCCGCVTYVFESGLFQSYWTCD